MPPLPDRSNRLVQETSPYLLQHANNPVAWWPWGDAALAEARRLNKPILLSVGYAACHWCHVMAHESFEDDATAAVMNDLFVSIKVDREERPDIDQIYMNALHLLGEQGGWPLTMFLTPRGEPFWGGTYFPKVSRFGRPAFVDVLREVARVFREEPDKIERNRDGLMAQLGARGRAETPGSLGLAELDRAAASIVQATDPVNGGLRGAPKFPQCQMLEFLWRAGTRTADPRFSHTTNLALTHMSQGGIYDHLAGGFARYSVDDKWLVPHFEKMLYDNAQILDVLTLEHARAPNPLYAARAHETVGWLLSEMVTDEGAFASSLDADSDGEEGKFYVWTLSEIRDALGADAEEFIRAYGVTETGNFEGLTILNRLNDIAFDAEADARLSRLRRILLSTRAQRTRPGRDDKVLADWNGLMIAALANASAIFDTPGWLDAARRAFAMIQTTMMRNGRLGHSWRAGRLVLPGFASDYAAMIRASLALFEVTQEHTYLTQAMSWQSAYERHHADAEGATYFLTADDTTDLIVRPHATLDDAIPNHNGLAAQNLIRLAALTGDDAFLLRADRLFDALLPIAAQNAFGHLSVLNALDLRLRGAQIVICGEGDKAQRLFSTAIKSPPAIRMVLAARNADALPPSSPALEKARMVTCPAAFICRGETCTLPIEDQDALRESLAR